MTWNYSGDPASSDRDAVRFLIGDTNTSAQLVSDEEIAWALTEAGGNVYRAASNLCDNVAAKFSNSTQRTVGSLSINLAEKAQHYRDLAKTLRRKAALRGGALVVLTQEDSNVYVWKGMHDNGTTEVPTRIYEES